MSRPRERVAALLVFGVLFAAACPGDGDAPDDLSPDDLSAPPDLQSGLLAEEDHRALPPDPLSDPPAGDPTTIVWPPHGARFAPGQRFDIRVEGTGTGDFSATLKIDGVSTPFTSGSGDPVATDGISRPGWGGFNRRGYSSERSGLHEIDATFTSNQGRKRIRSSFVIEPLGGRHGAGIRNVIILLGDGMGTAVRTAARVARHGVARGVPKGWLEMDRFPTQGMATTFSLNSYVTDSAPGMSAYSTGTHNQNNQEGVFPAQIVNPFFQPRVEYLAEYLHRRHGKVTGVVTTADVEDATPAAFAVHTGDRNAGTGIVDQFLDESDAGDTRVSGSGLKVLLGGGRRWFLPAGSMGSARADATDYGPLPSDLVSGWRLPPSRAGALDPGRDLISDYQAAGFTYVPDAAALRSAVAAGRPPSKLLGLFHLANMNVAVDKIAHRRGQPVDGAEALAASLTPPRSPFAVVNDGFTDQPMLDEMADAAIKTLDRYREGFVLLVEGASIDKMEHAQDGDRAIGDALEFDRAVGVARRFAQEDRRTLVLVLADHECGGFVPIGALRHPVTNTAAGSLDFLKAAAPDTATLDPSVQPERQKVVGSNFGGAAFPAYTILPDGYPASFNVDGRMLFGWGASVDRYERWLTRPLPSGSGLDPWDSAAGMFIRGQGMRTGAALHGASDVPVSAYAHNPRAHALFGGTYQNIDVFFRVLSATGIRR
jgi:alkaline phosphatase